MKKEDKRLQWMSETLRDATVLVLWLHHLDGVILHIEVDFKLPDTVCLSLRFSHCFLEVCFKTQSLQ